MPIQFPARLPFLARASPRRAYSLPAAPAPAAPHRLPYFVPRNSRGSLPVYTDVRNGRTRHLISIRNVQGDPNALAQDLAHALCGPPSPSQDSPRMKVHVVRSKHLVLSGGRWKHDILHWLTAKGF
ncbi:mitochondrial large subunit ribosomal protein-domain-containing protein [Amylostereum chailletii]|nr:mitochondrial large subunit ribosomal protein-domain-containing protein [Amylostereum chailletii]